MSFDGIFTMALTRIIRDLEFQEEFQKIYQPFQNEIDFTVRAKGENRKLLISAPPKLCTCSFTNEPYENPSSLLCFVCFFENI